MTLVDALRAASDTALIYDTFNAAAAASFLFDNAATTAFCDAGIVCPAPPAQAAAEALAVERQATSAPPKRKRRRRSKVCKSREDAENQRVMHIAVERNRRRLMNEYLAVLRTLMPESHVQRGDQASIVGGAIDFVKELEQKLQSLEAQKRALLYEHKARRGTMPPMLHTSTATCNMESTSNCSSSVTEEACDAPPFAQFFTYPQYVWCHSPRDSTTTTAASSSSSVTPPADNLSAVADIEVNLVETHANIRVMSTRRPGQLLKIIAGMQALRLTVLHLNVTTLNSLALYSLSVKVEERCGLTTVDDIAAAVHHLLCIIDAEAASEQLLAATTEVSFMY